jgi:hypothetical protein
MHSHYRYEGALPFGATWDARVARSFISAVLESHSQTNFLIDVLRRALPGMSKSPSMELIKGLVAPGGSGSSLHSMDMSYSTHSSSSSSPSSSPRLTRGDVDEDDTHTNALEREYETSHMPPMAPERLARICSASDVAALAFTRSGKRGGSSSMASSNRRRGGK